MSAPSGIELVICLIPAVIGIIIAVIVFDAVRKKPTKTAEVCPNGDLPINVTSGDEAKPGTSTVTSTNATSDSPNGLAVTSLIFSILAILLYIIFGPTWGNCVGPLAMIMGAIALLQIRKQGSRGKGAAIVGILIGTMPFIITLLRVLFITVDTATSK